MRRWIRVRHMASGMVFSERFKTSQEAYDFMAATALDPFDYEIQHFYEDAPEYLYL